MFCTVSGRVDIASMPVETIQRVEDYYMTEPLLVSDDMTVSYQILFGITKYDAQPMVTIDGYLSRGRMLSRVIHATTFI